MALVIGDSNLAETGGTMSHRGRPKGGESSEPIIQATGIFAELPRISLTVEFYPPGNVFRCHGETWTIVFGGTIRRFKDSIGLRYLQLLIANPNRKFRVEDLISIATRGRADRARRYRLRDGELEASGLTEGDLGHAGPMLDARARRAYENKVKELRCELEEAIQNNDRATEERVRREMGAIAQQLSAAFDIKGRARKAGDVSERRRKAVQKRIANIVYKIGREHEKLGKHLKRAIKTGTRCSYEPFDETPWSF